MPMTEVLKFGSSVLRSAEDLPVAVDEIYRHWRSGRPVLAVVSAFEGETDRLIGDGARLFGAESPAAMAAYVATGEQRTAALLTGCLHRSGLPARYVDPREIGLACEGSSLESVPVAVDRPALNHLFERCPILVLPGFYGIDRHEGIALFGRGGSDLSALFLAAELQAQCRLLKDVRGVFDADPARNRAARRFSSLTWSSAVAVAGPLIQAKALRYARSRARPFEVGRPNGVASTEVGAPQDAWADPRAPAAPLSVALLGCGVVGRGVYERIKPYAERFAIRHVLVRDLAKHADVPEATTDPTAIAGVDVIIECMGGDEAPFVLLESALMAGQFVVTANKAVLARHWDALSPHTREPGRRLWLSAAVGGAMPVMERLSTLRSPVSEIRGILNGTCGAVLEGLAAGSTLDQAVTAAQAAGFAEADPVRDLSGRDAADKLCLLIAAAFDRWLPPDAIPTQGIDSRVAPRAGCKMIARARRTPRGVEASVSLETPAPESFLGRAVGPENRIEIELADGEIVHLSGQGAGRWPTTVSVLGDLHEIARRRAALPSAKACATSVE